MNIFITVNKKSVRAELSGPERIQVANRIRYAMMLQDKKVQDYEEDIKRRGVCPQCHTVLPLTKRCSQCQIDWTAGQWLGHPDKDPRKVGK